jgi:hypothetical protein
MNRTVVSIALLLGPALLTAQSTVALKDAPVQTMIIQLPAQPDSCPVSLRAQQTPGGDRMEVNGVPGKTMAQRLHLTASSPRSRQVVAANVTVRGYGNKARVLPTGLSSQNTGDTARTIDIAFTAAAGKDASTDVTLAGFSAVTVIDVNSVTYSDGSTWKLAAGSSCRSWIDGAMLVAAH